jgi:hypothetical protein
MRLDVILQHLHHEAVDGATNGGNLLQNLRATPLGLERPLQRLHLASNAANAGEKLRFFASGMTHGQRSRIPYGGMVSLDDIRVQ